MAHTSSARSNLTDSANTALRGPGPNKAMTRSPSAEPSKASKRKGTRSVSTLTPTQLARKRANDREAQRAIRARTKEHIERLERELEELRAQQSHDETVRHLMKRNRMLEEELQMMRDKYEKVSGGMSYPPPVYDDSLSATSSRGSSSFTQQSSEFNSPIPEYAPSYISTTESCDSWVPVPVATVSSTVSSPTSTANDEYGGYIPTSVPPLMDGPGITPTSVPSLKHDLHYDESERADPGFPRSHPPNMSSTYMHHPPSPWNVYPTAVYYHPQSPSM